MAKRNRAKDESARRSTESAKEIVGSAADLAAGVVLGPLGGVAVAAGRRLTVHALAVIRRRRDRRVDELHEHLLDGLGEEETATLEARLKSDEAATSEYASLLLRAVQDEEDGKTRVYATLLRFLLRDSNGEPSLRRHLIKTIGDLSMTDLAILRELHDLIGTKVAAPSDYPQLREIDRLLDVRAIVMRGPLEIAAFQRLHHWGLVHAQTIYGGETYSVTPTGLLLLSATTPS